MEQQCVVLMPRVCEVLAGLEKPLHDDTSLEKMLDWFTGLTSSGGRIGSLLEVCPCLPVFINSVIHNTTADPGVISFTLKLTGLLAASEDSFKLLQEQSILRMGYSCQHWQEAGLWEDPCVRIGWIQGLRSMLQHPMALRFLEETELTKTLLQLQTDPSLFVASAANQLLAHVLVFFQPVSSSKVPADVERKQKDGHAADTEMEHLVLAMETSPEYTAVTIAILGHIRTSLVPKENGHRRNLQNLKLLALVFAQARPPLRGTLLRVVPGSLEALVTAGNSQLTLPLMDVLLTAYSCPDPNDQEVSRLLSAMLDTHNPSDLIHAAAAVLLRDHRDSVHTTKAVRILLLPLDVITGLSLLDPQTPEDQRSSMAEMLISKSACISVLCVCLAHTTHITLTPPDLLPSPPVSVIMAILSLLRISGGHAPSSAIGTSKAHRNVIGCGKIQKCGLEALTALSSSPGAKEKMWEVLTVLIQYLQNPDSDATVLQKCYQTLVKWLSVCTDISSMADQLRQDLQTAVWKRVCDIRWEVRDSTVEFLGQLASMHPDSAPHTCTPEALLGCSTTPLLVEALCDQESYVRASAISALAQTMARSWQQEVTQEQTDIVDKLLDILSQDSEGFPRRAVVQYFISWFSTTRPSSDALPLPPPNLAPSSLLASSVRAVLSQGSADLDWEVKGHTLELAQLLLDAALPLDRRQRAGGPGPGPDTHASVTRQVTHPYAVGTSDHQAHTPPPHTHPPGETHTEQANGVLEDAGAGSSVLAGVLQRLVEEGLVSSLLSGLFDCDRPVALKACQLLITLRETMCPRAVAAAAVAMVTCELQGWGWGQEIRQCLEGKALPSVVAVATEIESMDGVMEAGVVCVSVCEVLRCLGLEERMAVLTQSSDHVQNSPLSLLQDILTATDAQSHSDTLEVIVDCY